MKRMILLLSVSLLVVGNAYAIRTGGSAAEPAMIAKSMCFLDEVCQTGESGTPNGAISDCLNNLNRDLEIIIGIWEEGGYGVTELGSSIPDPDCSQGFWCTAECCQTLGICDPM